jgi:hypothetical protein
MSVAHAQALGTLRKNHESVLRSLQMGRVYGLTGFRGDKAVKH